jgi:hypothetical protein
MDVLSTHIQTRTTRVNLGDHLRSTSSNKQLVSAQTKLGSWHVAPNANMSSLHKRKKDLNISNMLVLEKIPQSLLLLVRTEHSYHLLSFSKVLHTKLVGEITILSMLCEFSLKKLLKPAMLIPKTQFDDKQFYLNSHIDGHSFCMIKLGHYECLPVV